MDQSIDLLNRALKQKRQTAWADELGLSNATFSMAKKRNRLSPTLAGVLAERLKENPEHWIAIAGLEAEPDSPARASLLKRLSTKLNSTFS